MLGPMNARKRIKDRMPSLLDVVALLADVPAQGLARGQVGTVVEQLGDETLLVEFSDDQGRAYAAAPCPQTELLILHYVPEPVRRESTSRYEGRRGVECATVMERRPEMRRRHLE